MKFLTAFLLLVATTCFGAVPDYKAFRGTGGIIVTTNPPTGTVVIDGSLIGGATNGVSSNGVVTIFNNLTLITTNVNCYVSGGVDSNNTVTATGFGLAAVNGLYRTNLLNGYTQGIYKIAVDAAYGNWVVSNATVQVYGKDIFGIGNLGDGAFWQDDFLGNPSPGLTTWGPVTNCFTNIVGNSGATLGFPAVSTNLYLSASTGNDTNAVRGRIDKPWRTFAACLNATIPGDNLYVYPGDYPFSVQAQAVTNDIQIFGSGRGSTRLGTDGGAEERLLMRSRSSLQNLTFYGAVWFGDGAPDSAGYTITNSSIINCDIYGSSDAVMASNFKSIRIENCLLVSSYDGLADWNNRPGSSNSVATLVNTRIVVTNGGFTTMHGISMGDSRIEMFGGSIDVVGGTVNNNAVFCAVDTYRTNKTGSALLSNVRIYCYSDTAGANAFVTNFNRLPIFLDNCTMEFVAPLLIAGSYTNQWSDRLVGIPNGAARTNRLVNLTTMTNALTRASSAGHEVTILDAGGTATGTNIWIVTQGGQTINGGTGLTNILVNYGALTLVSDGANWKTKSANSASGGVGDVTQVQLNNASNVLWNAFTGVDSAIYNTIVFNDNVTSNYLFSLIGGAGEANTASSLGLGWPLPAGKSSVDLRFNSITNGSGLGSSSNANLISIFADWLQVASTTNVVGVSNYLVGVSNRLNTFTTALSNNVATASSNNVTVAPGPNITITTNGAAGVTTYTVNGSAGSAGSGTNSIFEYGLSNAPAAGATTIYLDRTPDLFTTPGLTLAIGLFTTNCEIRAVGTMSGNSIAWTTGLSYPHAAGERVYFFKEAAAVKWWRPLGDINKDDGWSILHAVYECGIAGIWLDGSGSYAYPGFPIVVPQSARIKNVSWTANSAYKTSTNSAFLMSQQGARYRFYIEAGSTNVNTTPTSWNPPVLAGATNVPMVFYAHGTNVLPSPLTNGIVYYASTWSTTNFTLKQYTNDASVITFSTAGTGWVYSEVGGMSKIYLHDVHLHGNTSPLANGFWAEIQQPTEFYNVRIEAFRGTAMRIRGQQAVFVNTIIAGHSSGGCTIGLDLRGMSLAYFYGLNIEKTTNAITLGGGNNYIWALHMEGHLDASVPIIDGTKEDTFIVIDGLKTDANGTNQLFKYGSTFLNGYDLRNINFSGAPSDGTLLAMNDQLRGKRILAGQSTVVGPAGNRHIEHILAPFPPTTDTADDQYAGFTVLGYYGKEMRIGSQKGAYPFMVLRPGTNEVVDILQFQNPATNVVAGHKPDGSFYTRKDLFLGITNASVGGQDFRADYSMPLIVTNVLAYTNAALGQVLTVRSVSGNTVTWGVSNAPAGGAGGGTNYPPVIPIGTNVNVGVGTRQSVTINTNLSFKLVFTGTPLNGEHVKISVSNYSASVIYMTNTFFDKTVASNVTVSAVPALSIKTFTLVNSTNLLTTGTRWELDDLLGKELELAVVNNAVMITNAAVSIVTISNTLTPTYTTVTANGGGTNTLGPTTFTGSASLRTNVAPVDITTNLFVLGTRYTNSRRVFIAASISLTAAAAGTATVSLYVENPGIITNSVSVSAGPLASLVTIEQLSLIAGPGYPYYFVDETSGAGASVSIVPQKCSVTGL